MQVGMGRGVLRSTAAKQQPLTGWKQAFSADFPRCGKKFSIAWKKSQKVFHSVENHAPADRLYYLRIPRGPPHPPEGACSCRKKILRQGEKLCGSA